MNHPSMFGELTLRLAPQPENWATEALRFILVTHPTAWPAFRTFLDPATPKLPPRLTFRTQQASEDHGIPDLVGVDQDGAEVLVVEAKFWAALTDNQPVVYLRRLPQGHDAMLLMLAPAARLPTLWQDIVSRCRAANIALKELAATSAEYRFATTSSRHVMALASWRGLLSFMLRDAEARGSAVLAGDLAQLNGLCSRMDTDAFLPLRASEFAPEIGRRVLQLAELVDFIVLKELVPNRGASIKGRAGSPLKQGGDRRDYGRYFAMRGLGGLFCYSPSLWAKHGRPMWLYVYEADSAEWSTSERIRSLLEQYASAREIPYAETDWGCAVPIELPTSVEHANVIKSAADQVELVLDKSQPRQKSELRQKGQPPQKNQPLQKSQPRRAT